MQIPIYQVAAFAKQQFTGNPAAVCVLEQWLPDSILQAIARENNLSETAFIIRTGSAEYAIRWFTVNKEIPLCGHGTLAAAYVILTYLQPSWQQVIFNSLSGALHVARAGKQFKMNFPAIVGEALPTPAHLVAEIGQLPQAAFQAYNCMLVLENEQHVQAFIPDYSRLKPFPWHGLILTAPSEPYDFVSRFFVPSRQAEDPVTGSAHCMLAPYWAKRLNKTTLHAKQLSARGGEITCEIQGDRVNLIGSVVPYLQGTIEISLV